MKKKTLLVMICILTAALLCVNVLYKSLHIKACTYSELESCGYPSQEISSIRIDHSYLRWILGYNEWRISVEFEKEPDVFFWFTYKGGNVLFAGVSSEPMMGKEAVIEYSEKLKSGTLLD